MEYIFICQFAILLFLLNLIYGELTDINQLLKGWTAANSFADKILDEKK